MLRLRLLLLSSILNAVWLLPAAVHAEAEAGAPSRESALQETLRKAVDAYDAGDLLTARALFEAVHRDAPTARTLRSLGLVAFREQRFADAVALLEASLASNVKPLSDAQRESALSLLVEARQKTPAEPDALQSPALAAEPVVEPSEPLRAEAAVASPAAHQDVKATNRFADEPSPRRRRLKRAGYTLMAIGGAALITSLASYLTASAQLSSFEDKCRSEAGCDSADARKKNRQLDRLTHLSLATGIVGGLSASGGVTLVLLKSWGNSREVPTAQLWYRATF